MTDDRKPKDAEPVAFPEVREPSVADLFLAYRAIGRELYPKARENYEKHQDARIIDEYFGANVPVALLLVKEARDRNGNQTAYRTRLFYDASYGTPEFDEVLRTARSQERQYSARLQGVAQEVFAKAIFSVLSYLFTILDSTHGERNAAARLRVAVASARIEIDQIEADADRKVRNAALAQYLAGVPIGAALGLLLVWGTLQLNVRFGDPNQLSVCLALGAIGAVISVMTRITGKRTGLEVDTEQSRMVTMLAGGFRPVIGAVFGAVLYVLVTGELLPLKSPESSDVHAGAFFAGLAFLAGFSERWAQDTIVHSAPPLSVGAVPAGEPEAPPQPAPPEAEPLANGRPRRKLPTIILTPLPNRRRRN